MMSEAVELTCHFGCPTHVSNHVLALLVVWRPQTKFIGLFLPFVAATSKGYNLRHGRMTLFLVVVIVYIYR